MSDAIEVLRKYQFDERRGCLPETRKAIKEALLALEIIEKGKEHLEYCEKQSALEELYELHMDIYFKCFNKPVLELIEQRINELEDGVSE